MSCTVTIAVQASVRPPLSVAVKVTVLLPTSEQSNVAGLALRLARPQTSLEPLSMSAPVMLTAPLLFS